MALSHKCTVTLRLPTEQHAAIIRSALDVDEELAPTRLTRSFSSEDNQLIVVIEACDLKMLRTGISSLVDMTTVCAKTILEFA